MVTNDVPDVAVSDALSDATKAALVDDFAGDIAIWLRVHTDTRDWSSQTESVRGLAAHLVRVVENSR